MTQSFLDQAIEHACELLPTAEGDARNLAEPMSTVVIVQAAQGIIDNGGLEYFFEMNFPQDSPYPMFVDAYLRIGADAVATCIKVAAEMFPFPDPHLHETRRREWINSVRDNSEHEFTVLSDRACGDETVWHKLAKFVDNHRDAFGGAAGGAN